MNLSKNLLKLGILAGIVVIATAGATSWHRQQVKQTSKKVISISQSGEKIPSLFDGLPHVPAYSLKQIDLMKKNRPEPCKASGTSKQGALRQLFGISVVYAQSCFPGQCGGTMWTLVTANCEQGGECVGTYKYAQPDPMGDPCQGFAPNSGHCGSNCACGQSDEICYLC